jgi:hypothetical protein
MNIIKESLQDLNKSQDIISTKKKVAFGDKFEAETVRDYCLLWLKTSIIQDDGTG